VCLGRVAAPGRRAHADEVRAARLQFARRHSRWVEIERDMLVPRGPGWFVHADTDEVVVPVRGVVFEPESASPIARERRSALPPRAARSTAGRIVR
jgi:hypothetical protein